MFSYPGYNYEMNDGVREINSYIRVFHASPDAPPVDVYVNNNVIVSRLPYLGFTEYTPLAPGVYNIKVFPAGNKTAPVINTNVNVPARGIFTAAAMGMLKDIALQIIPDPMIPAQLDKAYVRFVHLSPNAPNVDITLPDGTVVFANVPYKGVTDYVPVNPGVYTLQARPAGQTQIVLTVPNINLKANKFYTVYAVGLLGGRPPLQVVIPLDGNSYLHF